MAHITDFLSKLRNDATSISFNETIELIDSLYTFTATPFKNGSTENKANENNGSCKILAFAQLNRLSREETLHLFGDYYRVDVLKNPEGTDHQNIRQFMAHGWEGIRFESSALQLKIT